MTTEPVPPPSPDDEPIDGPGNDRVPRDDDAQDDQPDIDMYSLEPNHPRPDGSVPLWDEITPGQLRAAYESLATLRVKTPQGWKPRSLYAVIPTRAL